MTALVLAGARINYRRGVQRGDPCPICSKGFSDCPHTVGEMQERLFEDYIRAIVRDTVEPGTLRRPRNSRGERERTVR